MKFALFYEIPVARPWSSDSEHRAYKNTLEQAIAGEQAGFHAFWTVEHHFLEEYSHCSNPEVLYGAIASRTSKMRLGYGVRLMPKPYNHPVRTAESVAVLDLLSDGRVDFGTGRSATRIELEGFGVDPKDTREMWREAIEHVVGELDGPQLVEPKAVGGLVHDQRELVLDPRPYVLELVAHGSAYRLLSQKMVAELFRGGPAGGPVGRLYPTPRPGHQRLTAIGGKNHRCVDGPILGSRPVECRALSLAPARPWRSDQKRRTRP